MLEEKYEELETLMTMNNFDKLDQIQKVRDELIPSYSRMSYFGDNDLDLFGYLRGIRTQDTFIKGLVKDIE